MDLDFFFVLLKIATALIMLFELRSLMQSSSADYYHPITQAVTKMTNPFVNNSFIGRMRSRTFFFGGFVLAYIIALIFWVLASFYVHLPIIWAPIFALMLTVKSLGYLVVGLLIAQALCSWLPSTRALSMLFGQCTEFVTAPVQRIIPPIGMIDISLMLVLIGIYLINLLLTKFFFAFSFVLGNLWLIM